jgi:valyl-tRNA synthetase
MLLMHPFMPFVTEEIWHTLQGIGKSEEQQQFINANYSIMNQHLPTSVFFDQRMLDEFDTAREVIAGVRNIRNTRNLSPKEALEVSFIAADERYRFDHFYGIVRKLANVSAINEIKENPEGELNSAEKQSNEAKKPAGALSFMVGTMECFVPMPENVNKDEELKKLQEDLKYAEGFLNSVLKKLSNEKFVNGAPAAVIEKERNKQRDAETKIAALKAQIASLG